MTDAFYDALLADDVEDLYENAPCGYLSTTPDGTVVKVNQTFLTWTGREAGDLVGQQRFADVLTGGGRIFYETHIAPMLRMQDRVREIAVDVVCADGRRLPVLVNAVLKRDESGEPLVVRIALFDATERRAYEQELLGARQRAEASEERARTLARTLQASLIPPEPPAIPGLDIAGGFRPAGAGDEVGGDFYDVFEVADGCWAVTLGDVCGKGASAAAITALARYTIRAAAMQDPSPVHVLTTLNEAMLRQHPGQFCTVVHLAVALDGPVPNLTVCLGGHMPPLHVRPGDAAVPVGRVGTLLGGVADVKLHEVSLDLEAGQSIVLFTDGLTEARRPDGDFYGEARLGELVVGAASLSARGIVDRIIDDALAFQQGDARDDIAVVVLKSPGTQPEDVGDHQAASSDR